MDLFWSDDGGSGAAGGAQPSRPDGRRSAAIRCGLSIVGLMGLIAGLPSMAEVGGARGIRSASPVPLRPTGATAGGDLLEVGNNDFRISEMGPDGDPSFGAFVPAVAYNATDGEYLVVWEGDQDGELEIFGQLISGSSGDPIGPDFRISEMGPDGDSSFEAGSPAVAYNATDGEYLVVWSGEDDTGSLVDGESEVFGQRLSSAGAEIGSDFRISEMGPDGDTSFDGSHTAVAYNATDGEYLVVWEGEDDTGSLVDDESEVFGQRLSSAGAEIGSDFRISDMGPDRDVSFFALNPAVAYNATDGEYLVVWQGDDDTASLVDGEREVFGQRLSSTGAEIGSDFRLSDMGPDGDASFDASLPAVAYNATDGEYLVVWQGDDDSGSLVDEEFEVFGQRARPSFLEFLIGDGPKAASPQIWLPRGAPATVAQTTR